MTLPALPPLRQAALLLDLDGTLLNIAPRPDLVVVAPRLPDTLRALRGLLGGALAVITGRPVEFVDSLLPGTLYAVAGEHGGAVRHAPGEPIDRPALPAPPQDWPVAAEQLAQAHPGVLLEHKSRGFALHFRAAPEAGPTLRAALAALIADDPRFEILPAHMAWEIRPRGTDKGKALDAVMARPPFAGRKPVFIGDDVTDEDAIRAARALGGTGYQVDTAFGTPDDVRSWLHATAAAKDWAPLPLA